MNDGADEEKEAEKSENTCNANANCVTNNVNSVKGIPNANMSQFPLI